MTIEPSDDRLLTRKEVSERFGIPMRFLETSANRPDGLPIIRFGRMVRYRPTDVRAWILENRHVRADRT